MTSDQTQHQTSEELQKARALSLESTRPPAEIPGYKLQRFIGSGAYGEVWSATDLKTGRRVAVKFYTRRSQADVQLLAQEVQKLVVLSNDSYVVGLLDVGWEANPPYYVMDYIEHGSLEDRLKNGDSLPASEAIQLFQEIATGMMNLHGKGILHCDLKPGNVLLDQEGKPRLADFGQSRLSTEETPALGTLFYMAPEQADMKAIPDAGWDVYGLGALLFSMLTGKPPYYTPELAKQIETYDDIHDRLANYRRALEKSPAPTEHRQVPGVDRALADLIDRCIAANPKKRFNNVQSVLLALRQRELTRARRPLMLLGLIGPLLLMGVVSAFGWFAFSQAISRTKEAVTERAQNGNEFAAKLAARSAAEQVKEYLRVVRYLANDPDFQQAFGEMNTDPELTRLRIEVADPKRNAKDGVEKEPKIGELRAALKNSDLRKRLQEFLQLRMDDVNNEYPLAASWFVSDRFGNQIASVFPRDSENVTLCNNYAFRTYFTGQHEDLELDHPSITHEVLDKESLNQRTIINAPHLSAVFRSQQSKTWKVAFSAPIRLPDQTDPSGIVAVTVNLGKLIDFENNRSHYAMLVDSREGENQGAILEHPLFDQVLKDQTRLPDELATITIDLSPGEQRFLDPVGETEQGKHYHYGRDSIVSSEPVLVQDTDPGSKHGDKKQTGLEVLAVQDYQDVLEDVSNLGSQLSQIALIAGLVLLGLAIGMWLFVNRMMRESRERLARNFSPSTEMSVLESMETVATSKGT